MKRYKIYLDIEVDGENVFQFNMDEGNRYLIHEENRIVYRDSSRTFIFNKDNVILECCSEVSTKSDSTIDFEKYSLQPISSAPKDGKEFLSVVEGFMITKSYWNENMKQFIPVSNDELELTEGEEVSYNPTHWLKQN